MGNRIQIAFFGDSICFGQGISVHRGWVPRISQKLEELGKQKNLEIMVANAGVNGNTTRLALERMPYDIQSHNFEMLIIQFGMNDCNYWQTDKGVPRVSKRAFEANLHEIIERAAILGCMKIFLNTNHPTTRFNKMPPSDVTYQESNETYNVIIRKVADEKKDVELIDIEAHIKQYVLKRNIPIDDILLDDKLHLSEVGHNIYFDLVYPKIESGIMEMTR